MIPYDLDPSLHSGEPEDPLLEDGFSPPHHAGPAATPLPAGQPREPAAPPLTTKSEF